MNLSQTQRGTSAPSAGADTTDLLGRWLLLARMVWILVVVLALGLFVASMPSYFAYLHTLSATPTTDIGAQLARQDVQQLQDAGLSINFYAWYSVILNGIFVLVYSLIGLILFLRKSENRMALFASFTLVVFSIEAINLNAVQTLPSIGNAAGMVLNLLGSLSISLFFLLFPSGRFEVRWIRWLAVVQVFYWTVNSILSYTTTLSIVNVLLGILFLLLAGSLIVVQVYRYRRLSTTLERQQTKWVVWGTALGLGGYLLGILVVFVLLREVFTVNVVIFLLCATFVDGLLLLFPISIAIAILRSRLWDIDRLINRTLVYGTLTVMLALLYFGSIIGLQALLRDIIHANNSVAIVVSTLLIAALFQPLRHRIQAIIDRRFYRRKYDAARTIAAFSVTLRNEVDLTQLSEHLVAVVEETMQPKSLSLWLRDPASKRTRPDHM
ncbi:MAG TPA: hypothetical protein VKR83_03150 [Ktedonobacteraceae bacterium]|nr:hypothetical protein [Ktedonobacteraceae bacterium]